MCFGAPEKKNLEPDASIDILSELEDLASVLAAEPEVIHRLSALALEDRDALSGDHSDDDGPSNATAPEISP